MVMLLPGGRLQWWPRSQARPPGVADGLQGQFNHIFCHAIKGIRLAARRYKALQQIQSLSSSVCWRKSLRMGWSVPM
jgi:hypothetical protein